MDRSTSLLENDDHVLHEEHDKEGTESSEDEFNIDESTQDDEIDEEDDDEEGDDDSYDEDEEDIEVSEDEEDNDHEPLQRGGQYDYVHHNFNDSIDEFEGSHEEEISRLIASTNKLLADVGIERKKITSKEELIRVAPSMVVAVFEALYHARIEEIERNPTTRKHYERNAQLVINNLSDQINIPLTHISGKSIVDGDLRALSNLVYIFKRIVTLTTSSQQSLSTIESNEEGGEKHRVRSGDSISTKDSFLDNKNDDTYAPMMSPKRSHSEPEASHYYHQRHADNGSSHMQGQSEHAHGTTTISGSLPLSSNTVNQSLLDSYIQKSLRKVDQQLDLELRQHRATRRRKTLQFIKQSKSMQDNARRRAKAVETKHKKTVDDMVLQDRSYQLQKMNEEIVLLREVYASLYREEIKLKVDEEKLNRHRQENAREYVQNHVENMERLFRERIEMLQEQEKNMLDAHPPTNNDLLEGVIHRIGDQQQSLMEKEKATVQQQRDRMVMWRRESYQDLLALLGAEKWSENLRQYSAAAGVSVSPMDRRIQQTVELLNARSNMPPTSPLRPFKSHPLLPPPKTPVPGSVYGLRVLRPASAPSTGQHHHHRHSQNSPYDNAASGGKSAQKTRSVGQRRTRATSSHTATTAERLRQESRLMEEAFTMHNPRNGKTSLSKSFEDVNEDTWGQQMSSTSPRRSTVAGKKRGGALAVMTSPNNRKGSRVMY